MTSRLVLTPAFILDLRSGREVPFRDQRRRRRSSLPLFDQVPDPLFDMAGDDERERLLAAAAAANAGTPPPGRNVVDGISLIQLTPQALQQLLANAVSAAGVTPSTPKCPKFWDCLLYTSPSPRDS